MRKRYYFGLFFGVLLIGFLSGWMITHVMVYIRLFFAIILVFTGSFFWNLIALGGIHLKRRTRSLRTSVGKVFEERFEVINNSKWSCQWLEIENLSPLPYKSGSRLFTGIGGRQHRSYSSRAWVTRRGAFSLGPTHLTSGDPFGIFTRSKFEPSKETLIVLPMTVDIPYFPEPHGILPGAKEVQQKTMDVTPHATGVREYVPGDPMKRVHWPTTAKRDQFMVKTYEQDRQAEIWIFLDSQKEVHSSKSGGEFETGETDLIINRRTQIKLPEDTYEYAISVTASLAKFFLLQKKAVGIVSSGSKLSIIPAERCERQLGKILETLAFLKADGSLPFSGCVGMQTKFLPMGSGAILVTPSTSEDILVAAEGLRRRNIFPTVVKIHSNLSDEAGKEENLVKSLENWKIPVVRVDCGENLEKQLGGFNFKYRGKWTPD